MQGILSDTYQYDLTEGNKKAGRYESVLKGIPSSPGLAIGRVKIIYRESIIIPSKHIPEEEIPFELDKFKTAIEELIKEFLAVLNKMEKEAKNVIAVLETNLFILTDDFMLESIKSRIKKGYSAESAVMQEFDSQRQFLTKSRDSILRERAMELDNIKHRLLSVLRDNKLDIEIDSETILVAQTLSTTDLVNLKEAGVKAIVTEIGGISSHLSILARSFEIPAVIGVKDATQAIKDRAEIIVDGYSGIVTINPGRKTKSLFKIKKSKEVEHRSKLGDLVRQSSETLDGRKIMLMSNIDFPEDVESAVLVGSEGIGLVRSENLILLHGDFPDAKIQYEWYKAMADRAYPNNITIRAFDVGSDKYAEGVPVHENNPALGFRGIRFLLTRDDLFKAQICAVLRASVNKNVKLMLPMITNVYELLKSLKIINICKQELEKENVKFDKHIPIGVMIETPAAALIADQLAEYVQFFSIGTNDLTQYTLAADRTNDLVADYYNSFHPGIMKLIKMTVDAAEKYNIPVSVCGEMAGHAASTSLLIGLGVTELSVSPAVLLETKNRVRSTKYSDSVILAEKIMKSTSYKQIRKLLSGY